MRTFGGDNLHTALYAVTKTGFVIDGAIRDLDGVMEIGSQGYFTRRVSYDLP